MPLISDILLSAMTISDDGKRRTFFEEHPVIVRRYGMVHRVAGFERRAATWMTFCGVSYEGNAYEEMAEEGTVDCMTCLLARC